MEIVLVPGLWLDGASWDAVVPYLSEAGHTVQALTLPGMEAREADRSGVTLGDHVSAVVDAVDAATEPALVVGHSAAAALAFCAADARPDKVARVVYVGGFPVPAGHEFMGGFQPEGDGVPFPGWEAFAGPDSDDIDEALKQELLDRFIPSPAGVMTGKVELSGDRRYDVPATVICPEFSPADLRAWIEAGEVPELARTRDLRLVDLESGHWPQFTQPARFAELILAETRR
jgi:pimeloyl-ACP methyl ester carboxylesterase